jgi:enoyl-CoA hydratase/carnithine racemase
MGENETKIRVSADGPVGIITLDRPEKLNAITYRMIADIQSAVDSLAGNPAVTGIVITGTGRGFCAGLDMGDLGRTASGETESRSRPTDPNELPALFAYLLRVPKPVIAAVNGTAAGGGFVLAMMCDLRFVVQSARFTTAFSKRGLIAEHGTSWLLPRLVGTGRALELLWSSKVIDAAEAYRIGFVDRVVEDGEGAALAEAVQFIRTLSETASPRSMARMKALVLRGWSQPIDVALHEVNEELPAALAHPDATEGVQSFLEKRPPNFAPWTGGLL